MDAWTPGGICLDFADILPPSGKGSPDLLQSWHLRPVSAIQHKFFALTCAHTQGHPTKKSVGDSSTKPSPGWLRAKPTNGSSKTWLQRDESQTNKWQQITPLSVNQNNGTTWTPKSYPIAATKKMVTHSQKRGFTILEWCFDTLYLLWYAGYQHFSNLPRA
jgi:hypothetical protein